MFCNPQSKNASHRPKLLCIVLLAAQIAYTEEVPVFRVDARCAQEGATGLSWGKAFADLQDGIDAAFNAGGGEVWVKAGVHKPSGEDRESSFVLRPGVSLYGGFRGMETQRGERNPKVHRTSLTGDIGTPGSETDNCYHVLTAATDTLTDGFSITRGNANGLKQNGAGGAIFIPERVKKVRIANCTIEKNQAVWQGGAVYGEHTQLEIINCAFFSNAAGSGGALSIRGDSSITVSNSVFSANRANSSGGAMNLEKAPRASIQACRFLFNSAGINGGGLYATADRDADPEMTISETAFADNRAGESGGAVYLKGPFSPLLTDCRFTRNTGDKGTGALAIEGGVLAAVQSCAFTGNRGLKKSDFSHDDASNIFDSIEALQAASGPAVEEPEPEPPRVLDDVYVFDRENSKVKLRSILARKPLTVLCAGDLTDTLFIANYRIIEALAMDFSSLDVQFFYLYRTLAHPENNGYVRPFFQRERRRQAQLAESLLLTAMPWMYDCMDNQTARALENNDDRNVYVFNAKAEELFRGSLTDAIALRTALVNLAGDPPTQTDPEQLRAPRLPALNPGIPDLFDRVHFNPRRGPFEPLRIEPADSQRSFYVKLRAEADDELLKTGNGRLYLGFHLDPLYRMEWDNNADPLVYVIWTPSGIAAPSTDQASKVNGRRTDTEPREFVLSTRQLDLSKSLKLRVDYTVYSPLMDKSTTVSQYYTIQLERDPFGGKAYRRQVPHTDPKRKNTANMPHELRHLDMNGDDRLSRAELNGNLWSKFPEIDTNRDGYLSAEEYSNYLRTR